MRYSQGSTGFKSSHDTTSKEDTIEGHARMSEFQSPFTGEIRFGIVTSTESTSSDENDVGTSSQGGVHGQHWRVEILERVMTSSTTTRPLTNDGESRMCPCNSNHLTKRFSRTRLERDILDTNFLEIVDSIN